MPTITVLKSDLEALANKQFTPAQLESSLSLVKGELKEYVEATGELRIELNDTNRPDLWCVEGIARHLRPIKPSKPPRRAARPSSAHRIKVTADVRQVRPYIGACVARNVGVTDTLLTQFIQTQEKLAELYGRKRQTVSIGLYPLQKIVFPVSYTTSAPDEASFVPLGVDRTMTLREILAEHPKGMAYGKIIADSPRYPLLVDARGEVLSFPPIINSQALGAVAVGDDDLLVEVTGTDLRMVVLAVNIWAANLADRGATVEPVTIDYPWATPMGRKIITPREITQAISVPLNLIEQVLGESIRPPEAGRLLTGYGHRVSGSGPTLKVTPPSHRDDILHPIDIVEDIAIARGYDSFAPEMPGQFTVGALSAIERYADRVRELLTGLGFQETMDNILTSRHEVVERMGDRTVESGLVEVDNPMVETFAVLRPHLLASLLRVEAASSKAVYPHRVFEVGEAVTVDPAAEVGCRTDMRAAVLIAHAEAAFSEVHAALENLCYALNVNYRLDPVQHPTFIDGRAGTILIDDQPIGVIGEVSPSVLEVWGIGMPCAAFDLALDPLISQS
ncbi:MAG: phenylalanine--tRNA ligase subunit beta [Nitrospirota bacterium]